jgi:hypothetical protein
MRKKSTKNAQKSRTKVMTEPLRLAIDRSAKMALAEQIRRCGSNVVDAHKNVRRFINFRILDRHMI